MSETSNRKQEKLPSQLLLAPVSRVDGEITIPGSKSLSNRVLLLAALAQGTTKIYNSLMSDDTDRMVEALKQLKVSVRSNPDGVIEVVGQGGPFNLPDVSLYLGNAGTAMRPLAAALCLGQGRFLLSGDDRMHERPIGHLVEALVAMGAQIHYRGQHGYPPIEIKATSLKGGSLAIDGSISSQFLTAVLLAAPMAMADSTIQVPGELVSRPYIDLTLDVMKRFGVTVEESPGNTFHIKGHQIYKSPGSILIEGDASSASYFLAAAAIRGGRVRVKGVGSQSVQGDAAFATYLEKMGARVTYGQDFIEVARGELHGIDEDFNQIPDAAMTIATTALFAIGPTKIRNIYNWRVK